MSQLVNKRVTKRLAPLYLAAFFQGFVIWYSFEKIFMHGIGFTDASIGLLIAIYSAVMLIAETPSGILADRWSRKGVLIIASIALALSSLVGGLSNGIYAYVVASILWGLYFAMYTGTYDSIIYDAVYEETGGSKHFDYYYGRLRVIDSVALVISALAGGVIAGTLGLREGYFLTIPFSLLAIVALLRFNEPKLHKLKVAIPINKQIKATYNAIVKNRNIFIIVFSLVSLTLLTYITLEFSQLWYIALSAPIAFYGPANAFLLASLGLGGAIVGHFKLYRFSNVIVAVILMLSSGLGLAYVKNYYFSMVFLATLTTVLIGLTVIFNRLLHDSLDSNIRAGASSAISTIGRILIIPVAILMGYLSNKFSIFTAAWVMVAAIFLLSVFVVIEASKNNFNGLAPKKVP
jgi:MFS family permease